MKNILGILLILLLLAPFTGTYIRIHYEKKQIRKEVKKKLIQGLDRSELVLLKFKRSQVDEQVNWVHSKEFEFKGQMYDIVETEWKGDSVFYLCWWDSEETALNQQLKNLLANALGDNPQNNEKRKQLTDFFKSFFYNSSLDWTSNWRLTDKPEFIPSATLFISFKKSPPIPPPKVIKQI